MPEPRINDGNVIKGTSLWKDAWRRLKKNRLAVVAGIVLILMVIATLIGPWMVKKIYGYTYEAIPKVSSQVRAIGPSRQHPMGTDTLGRDMLARVLAGGRISLMVAFIATLVSLLIGVSYGAVAGYVGGKTDSVMMRFVDLIYAVPLMIIVIVLVGLFKNSFLLLFAALGAVSWLTMSRIVRGQVLSLKHQEFVEAARAIGVPGWKIITRHLIPNTLGPVIVYATLTIPAVILQEAFLSFLGLGVPPPNPSWGTLVSEGANNMAIFPWMMIFPAVTLALVLFSLNFIGDGLRDALDPQMRRE